MSVHKGDLVQEGLLWRHQLFSGLSLDLDLSFLHVTEGRKLLARINYFLIDQQTIYRVDEQIAIKRILFLVFCLHFLEGHIFINSESIIMLFAHDRGVGHGRNLISFAFATLKAA